VAVSHRPCRLPVVVVSEVVIEAIVAVFFECTLCRARFAASAQSHEQQFCCWRQRQVESQVKSLRVVAAAAAVTVFARSNSETKTRDSFPLCVILQTD
jgi:hypothetical protein